MLLIRCIAHKRMNWICKALLCGISITGIEYFCGIIWNRKYTVWDYRHEPLNYRGQVCIRFTTVWCLLSSAAMLLFNLSAVKKRRPD